MVIKLQAAETLQMDHFGERMYFVPGAEAGAEIPEDES